MARSEYISREAAIARLKRIVEVNRLRTDRAWFTPDGVEYLINEIPAAGVRPVVKATWIVKEMQALFPGMDEHPVFACSECDYQIYDLFDNLKERHHFCPNCGAWMEES